MREFYSLKLKIPFQAISDKIDDFRAKRITAYLNLINYIVKTKVDELKKSVKKNDNGLDSYLELLPDTSILKQKFNRICKGQNKKDAVNWLKDNIQVG